MASTRGLQDSLLGSSRLFRTRGRRTLKGGRAILAGSVGPMSASHTPLLDPMAQDSSSRQDIPTLRRRRHDKETRPQERHLPSRMLTEGDVLRPVVEGRALMMYFPREQKYFPASGRWLRDNCPCAECRNQETGQRNINVFRMDPQACVVDSISEMDAKFRVTFRDGHQSVFSADQLLSADSLSASRHRVGLVPIKTWTAEIADNAPSVPYAGLTVETAIFRRLLLAIRHYGFAFVDDMPATPEATQALLESIGPIRNTHYGAFYDFTSDLSSKDTAYTTEALEPHTDNTYFSEPAGLQALHLLSHSDGTGGESSLVDGFGAAFKLKQEDEEAYHTLNNIGVHAHASGNEGISIQPYQPFPVFTHHRVLRHLIQVRWNNADRAGLALPSHKSDKWYDAAAKFDAIINDPRNQYWFQLKPGRMLIFDNWRILHGRAAFTGKRRMCGGYINRDDFISRFRTTHYNSEKIKLSTVTG